MSALVFPVMMGLCRDHEMWFRLRQWTRSCIDHDTLDQFSHRASALDVLADRGRGCDHGTRSITANICVLKSSRKVATCTRESWGNPPLQTMGRQSASVKRHVTREARHDETHSKIWIEVRNHEHICGRLSNGWKQAFDTGLMGQIASALRVGRSCGNTEILEKGKAGCSVNSNLRVHVSLHSSHSVNVCNDAWTSHLRDTIQHMR